MAADTLELDGEQIGDYVVVIEPLTAPMTPPVVQTGVLQATAAVNSETLNMLYRLAVTVAIVEDTRLECVAAISAIQAKAGWQGYVAFRTGGTLVMSCEDWTLESVSAPGLAAGFGGRYTDNLQLLLVGSTPPG